MEKVLSDMKTMLSMRFGGISPAVLRELSGVYQPFVKAVKEIISNSYDADAEKVDLEFSSDFNTLSIKDNGSGMGPFEFVREYIRIGKNSTKNEQTAFKGRLRIGGKGIGFLAPARYCEMIVVKTKKKVPHEDKLVFEPRGNRTFNVEHIFKQVHDNKDILQHIELQRVTDKLGNEIPAQFNCFDITFNNEIEYACYIHYSFDSSNFELTAKINFEALFSLDSDISLEDIETFCEIIINEAPQEEKNNSYTIIELVNIKEFVRDDLKEERKKGARNVGGFSGYDRFLWTLSRIIPVKAQLHDNIPLEIRQFIQKSIDRNNDFEIFCKIGIAGDEQPLLRRLVKPDYELNMEDDGDIVKELNIPDTNGNNFATGFIIGQSTTIFPAELRGILIRVKGVAVGEPTFFGFDQILSGSAKVALTQLSGEINIISGIDAIQDINPGREGFYKESITYNLLKQYLIGDNSDRASGVIKVVIDGIIARSEINASLSNFKKKYQSYRTAILEAGAAIAELASDNPSIEEAFLNNTDNSDLKLCPPLLNRADGKLSSFSVYEVEDLEDAQEGCKVNFDKKELFLDMKADIWKRNIYICGLNFDIELKLGKQKKVKLFCQVNPTFRKIYINWDHPIRTTMGDTHFIKHCLATVASELPQDQMDVYVSLMTNKQ